LAGKNSISKLDFIQFLVLGRGLILIEETQGSLSLSLEIHRFEGLFFEDGTKKSINLS
jgi:hypothetical protein